MKRYLLFLGRPKDDLGFLTFTSDSDDYATLREMAIEDPVFFTAREQSTSRMPAVTWSQIVDLTIGKIVFQLGLPKSEVNDYLYSDDAEILSLVDGKIVSQENTNV